MRNALSILLALVLALSLSACQRTPAPSNTPVEQPTYRLQDTAPLCRKWVQQTPDGNGMYELLINANNTVAAAYHDYSICSGMTAANITWRADGTVTPSETDLVFAVVSDDGEQTARYTYELDADLLFLRNAGDTTLFPMVENDGDPVFTAYVPDIVSLAPAYVVCEVYDLAAAKERYWDIVSAAVSANEDESALQNGVYELDEIQLMLYSSALFGSDMIPDPQGSGVVFQDGLYAIPENKAASACRVTLLELLDDAAVVQVTDAAGNDSYLKLSFDPSPADVGFQNVITGVTRLTIAE